MSGLQRLAPFFLFLGDSASNSRNANRRLTTGWVNSGRGGYVIRVLDVLYLSRGTVARLRRSYRINHKSRYAASSVHSVHCHSFIVFRRAFCTTKTTYPRGAADNWILDICR